MNTNNTNAKDYIILIAIYFVTITSTFIAVTNQYKSVEAYFNAFVKFIVILINIYKAKKKVMVFANIMG